MRVLVFSDLHLHKHTYGNQPERRLQDGADVLDQIAAYCIIHPVDRVVFGGDLFHTHGKIDADVLKVAYEGMEEIKSIVPDVIALVGNHDTSDKTMKVHAMHWLEGLGIKVIDRPYHDLVGMSCLPYTEDPDAIREFFKTAGEICFLHQGMDGVAMGSGFVPNSAFHTNMIPDHVKHVFTGHYHQHNRVSSKVTIIGSALQINWADEGDKRGFLVFDSDDPEKFEFHETHAPKFVTYSMARTSAALIKGNFIRCTDYEDLEDLDIEALRAEFLELGARDVEFVIPETDTAKLKHSGDLTNGMFNEQTVTEEFIKQKTMTEECLKVGREIMK